MDLAILLDYLAEAIIDIDGSRVPFKGFNPGVGPYGEPQLLKQIVSILRAKNPDLFFGIKTSRHPDMLIPNEWALEWKLVRPFGDNGNEAEYWSQNLLHPYEGNVSTIGDIYKLLKMGNIPERKAVIALGFEHTRPIILLDPIILSFEKIASDVLRLPIGSRVEKLITGLVHPVHGRARLLAWEIDGGKVEN